MILVLSNLANESANELVGMFPTGAASLVTASSFHEIFKAGVSVSRFKSSELTIGDTPTRVEDIEGVVSTIPHFLPQEFYYIEPADREYVCSELGAFVIYFLSELSCPKVNPPSAKSISGLGMHRMEWIRAAHGRGIPLWPMRMKNGMPVAKEDMRHLQYVRATIVGGTIVEADVPDTVAGYMATLSETFAMPYLSCVFTTTGDGTYLLADLSSLPDITQQGNREAIVRFLSRND